MAFKARGFANRAYQAGVRTARGTVKALRRRGVSRGTASAWFSGFRRSFFGSLKRSARVRPSRFRRTRTFADYA